MGSLDVWDFFGVGEGGGGSRESPILTVCSWAIFQ